MRVRKIQFLFVVVGNAQSTTPVSTKFDLNVCVCDFLSFISFFFILLACWITFFFTKEFSLKPVFCVCSVRKIKNFFILKRKKNARLNGIQLFTFVFVTKQSSTCSLIHGKLSWERTAVDTLQIDLLVNNGDNKMRT